MIFDLYAVIINFAVKAAHRLIGSFFWCFLFLPRLHLEWLSSEESGYSLKNGSDESSFQCLRRFFFFMLFFFFALESNDDDSDESDDDGSGSGVLFSLYVLLCVELSVDWVIWLFFSRVLSSRITILPIFSFDVSRSRTSLLSISESLLCLRYAIFSLIVSKSCLYPSL